MGRKNDILLSMREKLKLLSFLPTIIMLSVIFLFSGQQGDASAELSSGVTYKIVEFEGKIKKEQLDNNMIEQRVEELHFYVRKMGHISEFFLLGIAMSIPCFVYRIKGRKLIFIPIGCAILCAALDEFHQLFISGRDAALRDVFIDSIGIILSALLVQFSRKFVKELRGKIR